MTTLTFPLSTAARWWLIALLVGGAFSAVAGRIAPAGWPWPDHLPDPTQALLRLLVGMILGLALQAGWHLARRTARRA